MSTKFVQQKGKYFFLSNSISLYNRRVQTSQNADSLISSSKSLVSELFTQNVKTGPKTQYFFNNSNGAGSASGNRIKSTTAWSWVEPLTKFTSKTSTAGLLNTPPAATSAARLQQIFSRPPTFMDTLKASFFPSSLRELKHKTPGLTAAYATFRDLGYQGRASGWGRGNGRRGLFDYFKVPVLFTIGVCAFNAIVLPYLFQIPGADILKRHPEYVVYGLLACNGAVFLAWKSPRGFGRQLYRYGLLHKDAQFNKWQMIGSAFSHQEFWHLAINMFVLYQFGGSLIRWVGAQNFLEMYLDSAAISSLGSIAFPVLLNRFTSLVVLNNVPSLGASGAIFSLFGAFSYLAPYARLSLFFIPLPIGAWYVFLLTMGYNGLGMGFNWGRTDYAGHFAGCAAGILFGYIFAEKAKRAREQRRIQTYRVF